MCWLVRNEKWKVLKCNRKMKSAKDEIEKWINDSTEIRNDLTVENI